MEDLTKEQKLLVQLLEDTLDTVDPKIAHLLRVTFSTLLKTLSTQGIAQ